MIVYIHVNNECNKQMNIIKTNLDIFTTISIMNKYGKTNIFLRKYYEIQKQNSFK